MDFLYNGLLFCVLQDTCSYFLERMVTRSTSIKLTKILHSGHVFHSKEKLPLRKTSNQKRRNWACSEWRKFPTAICSRSGGKRINQYFDIWQCLPSKWNISKTKYFCAYENFQFNRSFSQKVAWKIFSSKGSKIYERYGWAFRHFLLWRPAEKTA